ncbi:hypothetical protein DFJ73DRAFT_633939 [Zopfochytrium polystomum]|nr:hypothetical protein DFJ73DRAFT_633939 [Zopfochytrium polystomum]
MQEQVKFTTTSKTEVSTAANTMMATMQQYLKFVMASGCGFPSLTILGEHADWVNILGRVGKLHKYGPEPAEWATLLTVVVQQILACFDDPGSQASKDF